MKTWWNFIPLMVFVIVMPFIVIILPSKDINGTMFGGGPIRELLINYTANLLPYDVAERYVQEFMKAGITGEYLLCLPICLNIACVLACLAYLFASLYMAVANVIQRNIYQSKRKASKGV